MSEILPSDECVVVIRSNGGKAVGEFCRGGGTY